MTGPQGLNVGENVAVNDQKAMKTVPRVEDLIPFGYEVMSRSERSLRVVQRRVERVWLIWDRQEDRGGGCGRLGWL